LLPITGTTNKEQKDEKKEQQTGTEKDTARQMKKKYQCIHEAGPQSGNTKFETPKQNDS
jgi:hypothetical protein